jgi:hypothetical protein
MGLLPNHSSNDLQSGKTSTSNMRNSNYLPLDLPVETSHDVFLHVDPGQLHDQADDKRDFFILIILL